MSRTPSALSAAPSNVCATRPGVKRRRGARPPKVQLAVRGFADDLKSLVLQETFQTLAKDLVIVG